MRCHYAVLGVARGATEEDIRKAYRRLVIALHPDKAQQRGEDPQKATEAFREVQAAYECLYDEQERAYYDANRDAILRGRGPGRLRGGGAAAAEEEERRAKRDPEDVWDAFEAELWPFFSREAFAEFDDSESEQVVVTEDSLTKTISRILLVGVQGSKTTRAVPKLPLDAPRALLRARRDDDDDHAAGLLPLLPRRLRARQRGRAVGIAGERCCF